ncbi:hypothetical protein AK812_SmicGene34458 [Symbiodinium microadriaticum]|uniref:Pentatricopeptide repeat-containing protein n=1 Tax=Symbiodinium microadriaticum TaxID=2951 RepID=A0A1Q9CNY2_SYMMI|nr:hypothetical protein AK812_SmicGene34458 [Symbiodinium microadriaticum]
MPRTWLPISLFSGPALINTIQACRQQRACVEGPDHVQQFAQLSAVVAPWYNESKAASAVPVITEWRSAVSVGVCHGSHLRLIVSDLLLSRRILPQVAQPPNPAAEAGPKGIHMLRGGPVLLLRVAPADPAGLPGPCAQGGHNLDARRAAKPTADPVPVGSPPLLVPDNSAVEAKPVAHPRQPSPAPSVESADRLSLPFGVMLPSRMLSEGVWPTVLTYNFLLKSMVRSKPRMERQAEDVFRHMSQCNVKPNKYTQLYLARVVGLHKAKALCKELGYKVEID